MTKLTRRLTAGLTGVVVFFAAWGVFATIGIATGAGLATVAPALFPALAAGMGATFWEWRRAVPPLRPEPTWAPPSPVAQAVVIAAACCLAALPFIKDWLFLAAWWLLIFLVLATLFLREGGESAPPPEGDLGRWDGWLFGLAAVAAITITILSNRPMPEDFRYLWMVEHALHNPTLPIFDLFSIRPGRQELYAWHPREVLVAALERLSGLSVLVWYYHVLPTLHAVMVVVVLTLLARQFSPRDAALVAATCVLLLVAWGEAHATFGNFSFARMFHGQVVVPSWAAPAAFLFGIRFGRERTLSSGLLLVAALICAYAQWHTGAVLAPLAAIVGALAAWPGRSGGSALLMAVAIAAGLVAAFMLGAHFLASHHFAVFVYSVSAETGLTEIFPPDFRTLVALALVPLAGLTLRGSGSRLATRALFFGMILIVNPYGMELLSQAIESLSFRVVGAFPFVLMMGLGLVSAARLEMRRWRFPVLSSMTLLAFLVAGRWITSPDNGNAFGDAGFKIYPALLQWQRQGEDTVPPIEGLQPSLRSWFMPVVRAMAARTPNVAPAPGPGR